MDKYISKQLAVEELENLRQQYEMHDDCDELVARQCKNAVSALPDADVAPVVRCRKCKYSTPPAKLTELYGEPGTLTCHHGPCNRRNVNENDFCSYGERRNKQ